MLFLPDDLIIKIFSYLDVVNLVNVSTVNEKFKNLSRNNLLWKNHLLYFDTDIKINGSYYDSYVYHHKRDFVYVITLIQYYYDSTEICATLIEAKEIMANIIKNKPYIIDNNRLKNILHKHHPKSNHRLDYFIKKLKSMEGDVNNKRYIRYYNTFLKAIPEYLYEVEEVGNKDIKYNMSEYCSFYINKKKISRLVNKNLPSKR